jgi:hypothetical protein
MRRAGILQKFREDFLSAKLIKVQNTKSPADIHEVEPIFAILVIGIVPACVALLIEINFSRAMSHTKSVGRE